MALAVAILAPLFSSGLPPGVDTPTFLHFNWLFQRSLSQGQIVLLWDPYWYGGMDLFFAYSPLSFLATALPAATLGIDVVLVYKLLLLLAVAATGYLVYLLARELGIGLDLSGLAAVLAEASYPLLSSIGLWGRYTTVLALPLALASVLFLERGLGAGKWRCSALGGAMAAATLLVHHMTGFVLLTMLPFLLLPRLVGERRNLRIVGVYLGVALVGAGWWLAPFLGKTIGIGYTREVAGLWPFGGAQYLGAVLDRTNINEHVYPSYFGPLALLALWAAPLAMGKRRMWGYVAGLAWLLVLSLGGLTPVGRAPGLASLDAARFHLYMAPFAAVLAAWGLEHTLTVAAHWRASLAIKTGGALMVIGLVLVTGVDAYATRASLRPYQVAPEVRATLVWLRDEAAPGRVFAVGFWHWDAYLLPAVAGRESVTGWYIEGARRWREVRPLEMMSYSGNVDLDVLWRTLREFDARYVVLYDYNSAENPKTFDRLMASSPLFRLMQDRGVVRVYEVLTGHLTLPSP
ncbi:MAG: hypothetical protein HYY01_03265 [Chloroflexi bacterium]|nr:hypothetical protein [Chloroflexota bacterium]